MQCCSALTLARDISLSCFNLKGQTIKSQCIYACINSKLKQSSFLQKSSYWVEKSAKSTVVVTKEKHITLQKVYNFSRNKPRKLYPNHFHINQITIIFQWVIQ